MASFVFINRGCDSIATSGGLLTLGVRYKGQDSTYPAGSPMSFGFGGTPEAGAPYQVILNRGDRLISSASGRMTSAGVTITAQPSSDGRCDIVTSEGITQPSTMTTLQGQPQVVVVQQKRGLSWIWWVLIILAAWLLIKWLRNRSV